MLFHVKIVGIGPCMSVKWPDRSCPNRMLKSRFRNFSRVAVECRHRTGTDRIHSFVRRSCRHGEVGIWSIANVNHADLVILAVEAAEGRLVVPLKIMDADQFRNGRGLFHVVAIGVASLPLCGYGPDAVSRQPLQLPRNDTRRS